ncbi:MAG: PAS domain S-box protein, partial [Chloroflexi bacterium]|nr:PAS domain S-box protein [Chloroflexota bacterium]
TLAAQVAVAVQNARAYMQTKQQATIIETSRDFISLADPQGTIVYLNSGGAKMIGYDTPAEIIGKPIPFVHFPEDSQRVQQEGLPKALETGYWQGENGLKHRDGRRIPVDQTIFVIRDDDGEIINIATIMTDITERKQAEQERQEQLLFLQNLIDSIPDLIFYKDVDGVYLGCNKAFAAFSGLPESQIMGKTDFDMFPPDVAAFFREQDQIMMQQRQSRSNEEWVTYPDGTKVLLDTLKTTFTTSSGEPLGLIGISRDITLRQQQEEEVRLAREEAEILYQVSSAINEAKTPQDIADAIATYAAPPSQPAILIATFDTGDVTTAQYVNILANRTSDGQTTSRLRIPPADFVGSFMGSPDDIVYINDTQNDPRLNEETRIAYRAFNAESVLTAPLEIGGRIAGAISVTTAQVYHFTERDVRIYRAIAEQASAALERLQLIQETQKRADELATVARVSAATTTILDIEELLQAVSDLTKESFHLYHAHIYLLDETGKKLVLAAGAGDAGRIMKAEGRSIRLDHPNSLVARAARERKGVIVNDVTLEPEFLPNPLLPLTQSEMAIPIIVAAELIGVLDVQSEITSRFTEEDVRIKTTLADQVGIAIQNARAYQVQQDAADRLREVDRLKSQFLANMSHELRTPLNSIIGYAEVMLDGIDGELTDDAIEDVQAIHSGGKHLLSIINDILDLAKIDAGQMFMDRQETDLSKIVEEVVHTCQILIKDKGIYLEIDRQSEIPPVYGDPVRLRQIVTNLVNNAIKFTEKGGITISIGRQDDQQVCVTVKDTGIGMSQKDLNVIFERFRQVDGSATRRAGGTGLGLAITRQLVQMHDGDIHVSSVLGEGSTFSFTLPVYEGQKV